MRNKAYNQLFALLLSAGLIFGQLGATVYAEGGEPDAGSLCKLHTAHGYIKGEKGGGFALGFSEQEEPPAIDSGNAPGYAGTVTITAFDKLGGGVKAQTVQAGTKLKRLTLPATLGASGYIAAQNTEPAPESITITGVTWELTGEKNTPTAYEEGRTSPCSYYFQPVLPDRYTLAGGAALPKIEVRYGWDNRAMSSNPKDTRGSSYHNDDIAAFKQILADHPELANLPGVDVNDPASWGGTLVGWDATTKRLTSLYLAGKDITGTLDVSGLSELVLLRCFDNAKLTGLILETQNHLTDLHCSNTGISGELDVSKCPELIRIWCNETPNLTGLKLGQNNKLTDIQCNIGGLSGELDVSNCSQLVTLGCSNNPGLTALKLGRHTELIDLKCSASGLKGTLDVSNCPRLETLWFHDNPGLTDLKLGTKNHLIRFRCSFTRLRGTLDVSMCPQLKSLWCSDNPYLTGLKLGTKDHLTDLFCSSTSLKGTLDASKCPQLQMLFCSDNPDMTELKLAARNQLTSLLCVKTGLSGTLDVSNCPQLKTLSCYDNKLETLNVSGTALIWLDCFDNLLTSFTTKDGYTLTVGTGTDGKAYMTNYDLSTNSAELTATPDSGYEFKEWTGLPPGAANTQTASFVLSDNISVNAAFARVTTSVTGVTLDKSELRLFTNKDPKTETLNAIVEPADATNKAVNWSSSNNGAATVDANGHVTAVSEGKATITATTADGSKTASCAVTVETYSSGGSDDGDESFDLNYAIAPKQSKQSKQSKPDKPDNLFKQPKPDNPTLAVIVLPATVEDGTATGKASDGGTSAAMAQAQNTAKRKGREQYGIAVRYDAKTSKTYDGFSIVIGRATLDRLIAAKVKYATLNTGIVDLTFDLAALKEIQKQAAGDITLTATRETGLAGEARAAVGSRPAYWLTVNYTGKDGKAAAVQNFGAGRATVGLAYTPAATEQAGGLYLVYGKDEKGVEWLYRSGYDQNSGNVIGSVGHFSIYGVGYKPAPSFTDTVNHWAKADIDFVASRGLLTGAGDATFTPDGAVTRGMFVTALGRLAGIDPDAYPSSSRFTDVPADAYYAPYVEWAASDGIVNGAGEKSFSPDAAITRVQMAAIMQRYTDKMGYVLPVARKGEFFADDAKITGRMRAAVWAMQQAGVMNGKGGRRFGPNDTVTRAEAAAVLRRFVKIVIDRATAGGWAQNDAGRWLYYQDAEPVTGWKQIDNTWYCFDAAGLMHAGGWKQIGNDWFYFYPDGSMAANAKIDGYEIGPDGVRKEKKD